MSAKRSGKRTGAHKARAGENGGIHSNAYNFLSAVNTGVDPRTGMYSASISLPGVAANNLCGPTVGVSLSFSALNPVDAGFGIGWSLTTTRYDTVRRRLSLSSGESFLVDDFDVANDTATYTCEGEGAPRDESGRVVSTQVFIFDALDNVVERKTTYADGVPFEVRRFVYATEDPTQLTAMVVEQGGRTARQMDFLAAARRFERMTSHTDVSEAGELIHLRFLQTRNEDLLFEYAVSLMRSRLRGNWRHWNG